MNSRMWRLLQIFFKATHHRVQGVQYLSHGMLVLGVFLLSPQQWFIGLLWGWLVFNIGHNIGAHRYFSHGQFETSWFGEAVLNFIFNLNLWGSSVGYASVHQMHHKNSDRKDDPHSVHNSSFLRAWILGDFGQEKFLLSVPTYKKLMRNSTNAFFHNYYFLPILLWIVFWSLISFKLIIVMFFLPVVVCYHLGKVQVVFSHMNSFLGSALYPTNDRSINMYWLKPLLLGDELHNNHHYRPLSLNHNIGGSVKEFDPIFWLVKIFFQKSKK